MDAIRILSIVWYKVLPARFGGQKGIANFNQALGKLYPLTCLCSRNNEPVAGLTYKVLPKLPVSKWQFLDPFIHQKMVKIAREEKPTHIILEHPYHARAALKACKATGAKLIVHSHNIESIRYKALGKKGWKLLYKHEKKIHQKADLTLFKTEEELDFAVDHFELLPDKYMVMPYGVERPANFDKAAAKKIIRGRHGIPPESRILLFAGTLDYTPNAIAVENIYVVIAKHLNKNDRIIVCGRNKFRKFEHLNSLQHPNVINAGEVKDIENYFKAADLFINPVMAGGGVQTKNLDALSYNLNVVCYALTLSGIDLSLCGGKVFTATTPDLIDFSETIAKALNQPSAPTPASFFDYYSFDHQVLKLAERL